MLRGYRLFITALVGWLILAGANHADQKRQLKQPDFKETVAQSLGDIAFIYRQETERLHGPNQETEPCRPGDDRRNSELCADWKAADAAANSAWWAWASGLVGTFSLIGVVVALGLAFHSNWIARDTARRQLRAYCSVSQIQEENIGLGKKARFQISIHNTGMTPARNFKISSECFIDRADITLYMFKENAANFSEITTGAGRPAYSITELDEALTESDWASLVLDQSALFVRVYGEYIDIFNTLQTFSLTCRTKGFPPEITIVAMPGLSHAT